MYTLWIRKPYDINEPTIVPTEDFPNALAYIVASSRWVGSSGFQRKHSGNKFDVFSDMLSLNRDPQFMFYKNLGTTPQVWFDQISSTEVPLEMNDDRIRNHMIRVRYQENNPKPEGCTTSAYVTKSGSPLPGPPFFPGEQVQKSYKPANGNQEVLTLSSGQALSSGLGSSLIWEPTKANGKVNRASGVSISLSQKDINRLNMAGNFIQEVMDRKSELLCYASFLHPSFKVIDSAVFQPFHGGTIRPYGDSMVCARQSNWFGLDFLDVLDTFGELALEHHDLNRFLVIAMTIIPAAYGGIHMGAIHTLFPSEIELTLWKSSCIILLGVAGLLFLGLLGLFVILRASYTWLDHHKFDAIASRLERWLDDDAWLPYLCIFFCWFPSSYDSLHRFCFCSPALCRSSAFHRC
jgi:hypothetical protein